MKLRWPSTRPQTARLVRILAWFLALPGVGSIRSGTASAAEPFFRTNDVIAFVGGEDVVEMQHNGYLELLLTAALPHHHLRFRNLAFEGDTVFEQHRQLNFPTWEQQLERVGATVVVAQFGQAESLRGPQDQAKFVEAYSALLRRITPSRRLILLAPTRFEVMLGAQFDPGRNENLHKYEASVLNLAQAYRARFVSTPFAHARMTRDGLHLNARGHWQAAWLIVSDLEVPMPAQPRIRTDDGTLDLLQEDGTLDRVRGHPALEDLRQKIIAKNHLWFDYWRPQNWAFLHGDRTEQASSRDHRDPKKRWFPEEMEKFLPLIAAKELEIWKMAEELAAK